MTLKISINPRNLNFDLLGLSLSNNPPQLLFIFSLLFPWEFGLEKHLSTPHRGEAQEQEKEKLVRFLSPPKNTSSSSSGRKYSFGSVELSFFFLPGIVFLSSQRNDSTFFESSSCLARVLSEEKKTPKPCFILNCIF